MDMMLDQIPQTLRSPAAVTCPAPADISPLARVCRLDLLLPTQAATGRGNNNGNGNVGSFNGNNNSGNNNGNNNTGDRNGNNNDTDNNGNNIIRNDQGNGGNSNDGGMGETPPWPHKNAGTSHTPWFLRWLNGPTP
jgi:hypothetical protein